ncbi:MAG TPA: hypothetical protein VMW19_00985 [Myxococcota bacterium]|nr:hypothetical protein [Myxococcota bacterium]
MAMFAMEISFLLALAVFAAGLVLLHHGRLAGSGLLRAAAAIALVGSALSAACTLYWGIRYHTRGEFDSAYPWMARMMRGEPGEGWGPGMMGPRGPGPGMMGPRGMMGPPGPGMMRWGGGATPSPGEPKPEGPKPAEPKPQ